MRELAPPNGVTIPVMGQGTWRLGENPNLRRKETAAIRRGVELGMSLIDTAEMYGEGATESFLGEALAGVRDRVFLVGKVYPHNAGRGRIGRACEASLKRLKTDRLDLYLLHWRGSVPLSETVEGMEALKRAGKIRAWGVSNLDTDDMKELAGAGGSGCVADQVLYNVTRRGPEYDLLPYLAERRIVTMAYSPIEQGRLPQGGALGRIAGRLGATAFEVALTWTLRRPDLVVIPKSGSVAHVEENRAAADLTLSPEDLDAIDAQYPPPRRRTRLEML